jgi:hypothetical protein
MCLAHSIRLSMKIADLGRSSHCSLAADSMMSVNTASNDFADNCSYIRSMRCMYVGLCVIAELCVPFLFHVQLHADKEC